LRRKNPQLFGRLKYISHALISLVMSEIEYVELEEEILPALAVGVRRLSDGVRGLKLQVETLSKQVAALKEESAKLAQLLEANKRLLDEERRAVLERYEEFTKTAGELLGKLQANVKALLDLELGDLGSRLAALTNSVDGVAKDLQAFRMEGRERLLSTMEEVKTLKEEVAELRSKINEMNLLIYSIEMKMRELEEKLFNELTEIKLLLMISKERESRAQ